MSLSRKLKRQQAIDERKIVQKELKNQAMHNEWVKQRDIGFKVGAQASVASVLNLLKADGVLTEEQYQTYVETTKWNG